MKRNDDLVSLRFARLCSEFHLLNTALLGEPRSAVEKQTQYRGRRHTASSGVVVLGDEGRLLGDKGVLPGKKGRGPTFGAAYKLRHAVDFGCGGRVLGAEGPEWSAHLWIHQGMNPWKCARRLIVAAG